MSLLDTSGNSPQRIGYIDALRGFTMFLVVLNHVAALCWQISSNTPSFHHYLTQVRMPMFFFISGFVLYKAGVVWNGRQIVSFFKKKIPVQLLSPLVFLLLFLHITNTPILDGLLDKNKAGYWFTFVLLEYYVFYAVVKFLMRSRWASWILILMGLVMYYLCWPTMTTHHQTADNVLALLSAHHWRFFIFFVLGTLVRQHYDLVQQWLDNKWLLPVCIVFFLVVNALGDVLPVKTVVMKGLLSLSGLIVLFSFFRNKQALFSRKTRLGRTMQYVGRRTLDIYLLHFLLLPLNLSAITLFNDHPMPIIEFLASSFIAIAIIAVCLVISEIIRLSPWLAHWLFGAKTTDRPQAGC